MVGQSELVTLSPRRRDGLAATAGAATRLAGLAAALLLVAAGPVRSQTVWDPNAVLYDSPPSWQAAAVAALNRHLPTDSGFWVLGPLELAADLPDTTDLLRTTLRILAPDPTRSRTIARRLWVPSGGVALEELQPADTLPHELPPGYPGRFLEGTIVGENVFVQVLTVQEHRWVLWAERAQLTGVRQRVSGPLARYSEAVTRHLAAVDSGVRTSGPPRALEFGLDPTFDLYARPPEPVIRDREGYLQLLRRHRTFDLDDRVQDVYGVVPGPSLVSWLEARSDRVLFLNREGGVALQHRYRDFLGSGARWSGRPVLNATTLSRLRPGRYAFVVDRYGVMRVGPKAPEGVAAASDASCALLAHGEPVRVAGELVLAADGDGPLRVGELSVACEEYFFSNLSLTLYPDVEERSDRYVIELGHALRALDQARVPRDGVLLRKF